MGIGVKYVSHPHPDDCRKWEIDLLSGRPVLPPWPPPSWKASCAKWLLIACVRLIKVMERRSSSRSPQPRTVWRVCLDESGHFTVSQKSDWSPVQEAQCEERWGHARCGNQRKPTTFTEINKSGNEMSLSLIVYQYSADDTKLKQAVRWRLLPSLCTRELVGVFSSSSSCTSLMHSPSVQGLRWVCQLLWVQTNQPVPVFRLNLLQEPLQRSVFSLSRCLSRSINMQQNSVTMCRQ